MGQMRFTGEFQVVVNGEVVGTAREVSYSEKGAAPVRRRLPPPETEPRNRHERRRAALLARRKADG